MSKRQCKSAKLRRYISQTVRLRCLWGRLRPEKKFYLVAMVLALQTKGHCHILGFCHIHVHVLFYVFVIYYFPCHHFFFCILVVSPMHFIHPVSTSLPLCTLVSPVTSVCLCPAPVSFCIVHVIELFGD